MSPKPYIQGGPVAERRTYDRRPTEFRGDDDDSYQDASFLSETSVGDRYLNSQVVILPKESRLPACADVSQWVVKIFHRVSRLLLMASGPTQNSYDPAVAFCRNS